MEGVKWFVLEPHAQVVGIGETAKHEQVGGSSGTHSVDERLHARDGEIDITTETHVGR